MLSLRLPRLLSSHQVPKAFQEDGIISGYRCPKSSAFDCILSLFHLTNETLNIWTHFLPACYFMRRLLGFSQSLDFLGEAYTWPLLAYLFTCCLYLLASSLAHTFSTMSVRSLHVCFFFDYAALSLYSLGSGIAYAAYIFPEQWVHGTLHAYFVPTAVMNTLLCTSLACYSRFTELDQPHFSKLLRILAFFCPYLFDNIPLFYRVLLCSGEGCSQNETFPWHYAHILLAVLTACLFSMHLPERLLPGRFDYVGHSHQLFHVSAVLGTHVQLEAVAADMGLRRAWLLTNVGPEASYFTQSMAALGLAVGLNLGLIAAFSLAMWRTADTNAPHLEDSNHNKLKEH
ncbi:membrane progestin receptor delta isoform X1 [Petromyzon marinus]|uniref:membrane progestin receptor delta isoform X1 n=2 Tax=Petromyzon marinus TaxID=7757 RepID=UPI003F72E48E